MPQELINFYIGIVILSSCMFSAKMIQKYFQPPAEIARKLVHVFIGTVALFFPYLFQSRVTALVLSFVMFGVVLTLRLRHLKKKEVGSYLYSVERSARSLGELVFPIAIGSTFWMAKHNPILYFIPILILTYADTVAAIVGTRLKKGNLSAEREDEKSLGGSIAFAITAFMCVVVILVVYSEMSMVRILCLALIIGVLTALVEATSSFGLDNLLIPLLCYAFLFNQLPLSLTYLVFNLLFIGCFAVVVYKYRHVVDMSKLAIMESVLAIYITFLIGGIRWGLAPITVLVLYPMFPRRTPEQRKLVFNKHVIESNLVVGIILLFYATIAEKRAELFMIFYLVFGLHIALNHYGSMRGYHGASKKVAYRVGFLKGLFLIIVGAIANNMEFGIGTNLWQIGLCVIVLIVVLGIAARYLDKLKEYSRLSLAMAWKQAGLVMIGTVVSTVVSLIVYAIN